MSLEDDFHEEMRDVYQSAGNELNYWAKRFWPAVKRKGALQYVREKLKSPQRVPEGGLQALIEAGRSDLSMEARVLKPKYRSLFSEAELDEARMRLDAIPDYARRKPTPPDEIYPDELKPGLPYFEGAVRQRIVNVYERNEKARDSCLEKKGYDCSVCSMNFEKIYGQIGHQFMHVHHLMPLATIRASYELDPERHLVPVCPNCHAMLHRSSPPLSVSELKARIAKQSALR
ncbi:HNH endonuclease domain-containing protein [Pseudomonas sp. StFLB209]|uniref:HNH endonuclease n=1 Tax=Pseudomonas sp. StFLB209 TaxID=1028989 RepID=UPI0004F8F8DF|nr:HNH endonuclease [Pseudomonas sp. StFLB209]BAP44769.1 HNH endonuclease domain-containing protein [Pseudomonas sp. StFLB209]